jgi:hypothetical protein
MPGTRNIKYNVYLWTERDTLCHSCLRHCATSLKVAGSIPDGLVGIFYWRNPSGRTMVLGLTHPLTEISTRNISLGVKAAAAQGWQPYHLLVPTVMNLGASTSWNPQSLSRTVMGLHLWMEIYFIEIKDIRYVGCWNWPQFTQQLFYEAIVISAR